jgi:tetratricopeptide (TPR) repeat protein
MSTRKQRRAARARAQPAAAVRADTPGISPRMWWVALALAVVTVLAYVPALAAPFVMDDVDTIGASAAGQTLEGSPTAGRPLVTATLAANFALNDALGVDQRPDPDGPRKAVGYRLFNLLLHLMTGALLFGLLRRAMRERAIPEDWRAVADPLAGVVCALWLLHPIQSEVINYIVQRSEAMASLLYLATLYASMRTWDAGSPPARVLWSALAVLACVLGMLSKEIVISAPLAVMLFDRAFRLPSWRALLRPGNGRGWLYAALWAAAIGTYALFGAGPRGETAGFGGTIPWYDYLYTQCWAVAHYLRLAAWPSPLAIDYGFTAIRGARGIPGAVILVAFACATLAAWTRVPRYGWFAFAGSCFFMLLAPSSSVVPVGSEIAAERRVYLALAAVLVIAAVAVEQLRRRFASRLPPRWLAALSVGIALVLAISTAARSTQYATNESLWRSAVRATPENPRALGNLGWALYKQPVPNLAAAESAYAKASVRDSTCHYGCLQHATVLTSAGRFRDAEPLLERVVAADSGSPQAERELTLAERELALVLMRLGDFHGAISHLAPVAERYPAMDHLVVLGVAYLSDGRREDAIATFRRVATLDGGSTEMRQLSDRLEGAAQHPEALLDLQQFAWRLSQAWM